MILVSLFGLAASSALPGEENRSAPWALPPYGEMIQTASLVADYSAFYQRGFDGPGLSASDETLFADINLGLRIAGLVLESTVEHEWTAFDFDGVSESERFTRRARSRLVYDRPAAAQRLIVGDITTTPVNLQGSLDLLGVSAATAYSELQPLRTIRTAGERLVILERRSIVEILDNGVVAEERVVAPGQYTAADFRQPDGSSDLRLRIRDDRGKTQEIDLSGFGQAVVLAPDIVEYGFSLGVPAEFGLEGLDYDERTLAGSGFYRRALTPNLTGTLDLQWIGEVRQAGAELVRPFASGVFRAGAALSEREGDWGAGASFSQDWPDLADGRAYLNVAGVWYSEDFSIPGFTEPVDFVETLDPDPENPLLDREPRRSATFTPLPFAWEVTGDIGVRVTDSLDLAVGGAWRDLRGDPLLESGAGGEQALFGSASLRLTERATLQINVNEFSFEGERERSVFARLQVRFGERGRGVLQHRSDGDVWRASYARTAQRLTDGVSLDAALEHEGDAASTALEGDMSWIGNRGCIDAGLRRTVSGRQESGSDFAFAGVSGAVIVASGYAGLAQSGFGAAPFTVLRSAEENAELYARAYTLDGETVEDYSARSGALGPAVVSDALAYTEEPIDYLLVDVRQGCIVEEGAVDVRSAYRSVTVVGVKPAPEAGCLVDTGGF
jgi:outer membrane usher protein FimD/PapC